MCVLYRGSRSNTSQCDPLSIEGNLVLGDYLHVCLWLLFKIVAIETGGLFNLAVDLMQLFSENTTYVGCMQQVWWYGSHLSFVLPPSLFLFPFLPPSLPPSLLPLPLPSHQCSDFSPLLDALGLFFQIRDDYANLKSNEVWSINHKHIINFSMYQFCVALY